ncbi:MAG: hypothetical protein R2795_11325 [Saprospiraceae bacterium]
MNVAGLTGGGDEKRKQMTHIYGVTFPKQKDRRTTCILLEEAKKRDHRKIGQRWICSCSASA